MAISLHARVSQQVALTPQLQQSIRLLQLSNTELEQELAKVAEENPLLEFEPNPEIESNHSQIQAGLDSPQITWSGGGQQSGEDDEDWTEQYERLAHQQTLLEYLQEQIHLLKVEPEEQSLVAYLAGCLDDRGYLPESIESISQEISLEIGATAGQALLRASRALDQLQQLDPPGVGAKDLSQCLSLQIERILQGTALHQEAWELALAIAKDHLHKVGTRDWLKLKQTFHKTEAEVSKAVACLRSLQHNPGAEFEREVDQWILPDVVVKQSQGQWVVNANQNARPKLSLNSEYARILKESGNDEATGALKQKMLEASWLVKNIIQREETILKVAKEIVARQQKFFAIGALGMRPLVLREIAEAVGMHESTISRVTTQKYLSCPLGIFEFKYFFSSQLGSEQGGSVSSTAIQALIKQIIAEESNKKPISDSSIASLLASQGYVIARRTVAKYREALRIPAVHLRKH